jgi:paraquat-inducible protein B
MSEFEPGARGGDEVADAVVVRRTRLSIVWLIPLVAALVGAFVAWRAYSERGPEITITFRSAEGLEAGKTKVKYKDVEVGLLEEVRLTPDLSGVECHVRMVNGFEEYLRADTRFWVMRARIAGGQVTGLGTLLSGDYIGVDPVREGKRTREFTGLEEPPVVTMQEPGRYYVLRSGSVGAIDVGSPVYFRRIAVGRVVSSQLGTSDDTVTTRIFVRAPYDQRVHESTRFWNASGIDMSVSASGLKLDTQSLVSILIGGIAFDTPEHEGGEPAAAESEFALFENREAAEARQYTRRIAYQLHFDQSVRGLAAGSPVEFRGIVIGEVTDVRLELDEQSGRFRIPVRIEIEPERFTRERMDEQTRREFMDRLVAAGLRAQLKSGNLLTGQLVVGLDMFPKAKPAQMAWNGPLPEVPTIPTPIEEITANLTQLVDRLGKLPVEQIGAELNASLKELRGTLEQAERTLASANALIRPDSAVTTELRRTLLELSDAARALGLAADQIESEPDSLIFGKRGGE